MPPGPRKQKKPFTPGLDPKKPWHGNEVFYLKLRLKDMVRQGFIDGDGTFDAAANKYFQSPRYTHNLSGVTQGGSTGDYEFIHPIFKQANWTNIGLQHGRQWPHMIETLKLASSILCEPHVLRFYQALLQTQHWTLVVDPVAQGNYVGNICQFGDKPLTDSLLSTFKALNDMQDSISWTFVPGKERSWATTKHDFTKDGVLPNVTCGARIELRDDFFQAIAGRIDVTSFAKAQQFNGMDAHRRAVFFFATTILHELAHAVHLCSRKRLPDRFTNHRQAMEPYWRDTRVNELGWQFGQIVFGGGFVPLGRNPISAICPYGMLILRFPFGGDSPGFGRPRMSTLRANDMYMTQGAVDMGYINSLLTRRFWDTRDTREALKFYWKIAVQAPVVTPNLKWLEGEPHTPLPPPQERTVPSPLTLLSYGFSPKSRGDLTSEDSDYSSDSDDSMDESW